MISRRSSIRGSTALITSALLLPRKSRAWTHGNSGSGGYGAKAIHVDDFSNGMVQLAPTIPDSSMFSGVLWSKVYMDSTDELNFWACGNDVPLVNVGVGETLGFQLYNLNAKPDFTTIQDWQSVANTIVDATWQAVFFNADTQNGTTQYVVNDAVLTLHRRPNSDYNPGFNISWSANTGSQSGFQIPRTGSGIGDGSHVFGMDMADPWITTSHLIDWSVTANRRKFQDGNGKPVDLGSDGSTPFGYSPEIFFSGTAAQWVTPGNRGTCGPFVKIGNITNASTSPSD